MLFLFAFDCRYINKSEKKYLTDVAVFFYRRNQFNPMRYRRQGIALTIKG
ncbi:hypothetical protein VISP3789_00875 [Vibrio splendidus ATCC 33789]|nr:hypothetical protein VISP3789_00875 [Vibrio splendidus ATCC 33789]